MEWNNPRRYLIIFTQRGGSTFLVHCLDSHIDIGAERGEPLNPKHVWHRTLQNVPSEALLDLVLGRWGYKANVAKVNYRHIQGVSEDYLNGLNGIIHLYRENVVRIIASAMINTEGLRPAHSYNPAKATQVTLDPAMFRQECERYTSNVATMKKWLGALNTNIIHLTYDEVVGGEGKTAQRIPDSVGKRLCAFLGVQPLPLYTDIQRTNPEKLSKLIVNWGDILAELGGTEYRGWALDE